MAPIHTLLFICLSLSITVLMFSDSQPFPIKINPNISIAVQALLFFLVPLTFISAIILLLIHVAVPQSIHIKNLTKVTLVLVSSILLFGVPVIVHMSFTEAVTLYNVKFMFIGAAAAAIYKYDPFNRCINYAHETITNLVPAFVGLCISASTFMLIGSFSSFSEQNHESTYCTLVPVSIGFLFISLNYFNLLLAMVRLFVSISVPADGPKGAIAAVLVKRFVAALPVMSCLIVLMELCMIVEFLVGSYNTDV